MDVEERISIIKGFAYEIITEQELRQLFETKNKPKAYDGFEPSGLAHIPVGIYRPLLIREMQKAGIEFHLLLADSFAWINNKFGGNLEVIRKAGEYFLEVWKASKLADMSKVRVHWHKDFISDEEYWKKVLTIARNHTLRRTLRALTIAGRGESLDNQTAVVFYPSMQAADIFYMDVDICQLGLDQRKVNMLAREIAEKLDWKKPVAVHHNLLMGLQGPVKPQQMDEDARKDVLITSKMSKSKPDTAIFVHDSYEDIRRKLRKAYTPPKQVEDNPILQYFKEIIFRVKQEVIVERPAKFGGNVEFKSYEEMERAYKKGEVHPLDLKEALAKELNEMISPIREHFEKNKKAKELYLFMKEQQITR
ncbi:MAG: tyrosine--tRNA ligase [Candidatus Nanohaloarchaeota archaeon]|nr:tyrosine--tRNA ligase [Candidatus Nanohaloarchaeota archaeon]